MIRVLVLLSILAGLGAASSDTFEVKLSKEFAYLGVGTSTVYVTLGDKETHFCFNGFLADVSKPDCISISVPLKSGHTIKADDLNAETLKEKAEVLKRLPTVEAVTTIFFTDSNGQFPVKFFSAGAFAGLIIKPRKTLVFKVINLGSTIFSRTVTSSQMFGMDVSTCRSSDGKYLASGKTKALGNCKKETCQSIGNLVTTACPENEVCESNICMRRFTCTLTGPSIVDIAGGVGSIKDRCTYNLMTSSALSGFVVSGEYGDRRLKDVSFLDTLVIKAESASYKLGQGGSVEFQGKEIKPTSTPKDFGPLKISKTEKGVTAVYTSKIFKQTVLFDGYTAQIQIQGPPSSKLGVQHLCAKANTDPSLVRTSKDSACQKKVPDKFDGTEACKAAKVTCAVLTADPFTKCHKAVGVGPYAKACTDTLCTYPVVDNLPCQFLEAYAQACEISGVQGLTGWRAKAQCPTDPKALCQDKTCASMEFCGQEGGTWSCLCRSIFAMPYKATNSLGDPTVCSKNTATASLVNCLLIEKGIDYNTLHLNDPTCKGQMSNGLVTFGFSKDKLCKAEVEDTDKKVTYKNTIKAAESTGPIVRQDEVAIDFSCSYAQPQIKSVELTIKGKTVVTEITSGTWKYDLTMKVFSDSRLSTAATSVKLNQMVWVELKTTGLDEKLVLMVIDSCWATKEKSEDAKLKYYLVTKGCPNTKDGTVQVTGNGAGTSASFSFKTFQFSGSSTAVYLHCKVNLCGKKAETCVPDCKTKQRRSLRSIYLDPSPALITMTMTK